jgi:D-alanyl-lipoteichoic acid acyltransferase DltB (MBOAT superfamily)
LAHAALSADIAVSICVNFTIGKRLSGSDGRVLLGCGIAFNLGLLVVFKYADFIVENLNLFRVEELTLPAFVLPLAISFYTFQQIAYLIDVSRGHKSVKSILRYAFFVGFFPQLIAGPIVHQHEILPQLNRMSPNTRRIVLNLCIGLTIFFLGLAKKNLSSQTTLVKLPMMFLTKQVQATSRRFSIVGMVRWRSPFRYISTSRPIAIWRLDWGAFSGYGFR